MCCSPIFKCLASAQRVSRGMRDIVADPCPRAPKCTAPHHRQLQCRGIRGTRHGRTQPQMILTPGGHEHASLFVKCIHGWRGLSLFSQVERVEVFYRSHLTFAHRFTQKPLCRHPRLVVREKDGHVPCTYFRPGLRPICRMLHPQ